MSEPKRYDMTWGKDDDDYIFVSPSEQPKGRWVKWEDYAALKTDLDYVRKMRTQETLDLQEMSNIVNEVRAENERLRKAGDDLEFLVCFNYEGDIKGDKHCMGILDAWLAAKERNR